MMTYIGLLRGVNVSGKNRIKMQELRNVLSSIGLHGIKTYLQSGNLIFSNDDERADDVAFRISAEIKKSFDLQIEVLILSLPQFKTVVEGNPFVENRDDDLSHFHVTLFQKKFGKFSAEPKIEAKRADSEKIQYTENGIYLYCPHGYGKTKLTNNFIERQLSVVATTRNWKTILALLDLAESD